MERFLPKTQHTHRKLLKFENWCNGKVWKSAKIQFSKSSECFSIFIFIEEYPFRSTFLLLTYFDKITLFYKMMPNFWHLPITPILKIQSFLVGKNLSNFVLPLENSRTRTTIIQKSRVFTIKHFVLKQIGKTILCWSKRFWCSNPAYVEKKRSLERQWRSQKICSVLLSQNWSPNIR